MSENEREARAFEAIIASQLLRERDPLNLDDLPDLTDAQRAAMNAMPANIVEKLWDEIEDESEDEDTSEQTCTVDETEFVGMNRAEDMTEETRQALEQARNEVLDSMKKQREQGSADS